MEKLQVSCNDSEHRHDRRDRCFHHEAPMMLNAWTQTSSDLQSYIGHPQITTNFKNDILTKFQKIEDELRAQSDKINEFSRSQSASELKSENGISNENEFHLKYRADSDSSEVQQNSESVKYRIIADGSGNINGNLIEPIEIQLAEEDGALELNNSVETGSVQFCLNRGDVAAVEIVNSCEESQPSSTGVKRKRKLIKTTSNATSEPKMTRTVLLPNKILNSSVSSTSNNVVEVKPTFMNSDDIATSNERTSPAVRPGVKMVSLGPNNTQIPEAVLDNICWTSTSFATRKLLMAMFDRQTLATHSMTGKPSPAFKHNKPQKKMLNPAVIGDIIFTVKQRCGSSEKEIRNAITTKCADENKMLKLQEQKIFRDKENSF